MKAYYSGDDVTLYHGDSLAVLREMPDQSVNCCVTSPPYFGLRDYGVEGQYGLEASPAEYVETMRGLFADVRRVLTDDGTLWLNLGDSYSVGSTARHNTNQPNKNRDGTADNTFATFGADFAPGRETHGIPAKSLLMVPERTAMALQDDGWILRNKIVWHKTNAMPESVTDRLSNKHEHLFMFSKSRSYWFDLDPIREPAVYAPGSPALSWDRDSKESDVPGQSMRQHRRGRSTYGERVTADASTSHRFGPNDASTLGRPNLKGRNPGDVWSIPTSPFAEAHFACFPPLLAERAILAGCKPGGTVLDPFSGSGTTGLAATKHGRKYVGVDLSADYLDLSLRTRFAQPGLDLFGGVG